MRSDDFARVTLLLARGDLPIHHGITQGRIARRRALGVGAS